MTDKQKNSRSDKSKRSLEAGTSGRTKPQKKDFRNMAMSLKDESDTTKKLYHPELIDE